MATIQDKDDTMHGPLAGVTYYRRNGQLIARVARNREAKPVRTSHTMAQRTKWSNLVSAWRALGPSLKGLFEQRRPGQTDYNVFMSVNLAETSVHLTEAQAKERCTVADAFYVSVGTLRHAVEVTVDEGCSRSSLAVSPLCCTEASTYGQFGAALVELNPGQLVEGDELVFLRVTQWVAPGSELPYLGVRRCAVRLTRDSDAPWVEALARQGADDGFLVSGDRLVCRHEDNSLVAWVIRRPSAHGPARVTTQRLVGFNALLPAYTSAEARDRAITSYDGFKPYNHFDAHAVDVPALRLEMALPPAAPTIAVTAQAYPAGAGVAEGTGCYREGERVTLRAVASAGHRFLSWTDGVTTAQRAVDVSVEAVYTAIFVPDGL